MRGSKWGSFLVCWLHCFLISSGFTFPPSRPPPVVSSHPFRLKLANDSNEKGKNNILSRFTSPIIDDPFLPLADVSVAQIVAPSLEVLWLTLNRAPSPTWLRPIFDSNLLHQTRGSLVAPTLIHGAALASCWIVGALAAKAYEQSAIVPSQRGNPSLAYGQILVRVLQGGAFATGILLFATHVDLFAEFGFRYVQVGESDETDFRILTAFVELINDVFFEAFSLISWRLFVAFQNRGNVS